MALDTTGIKLEEISYKYPKSFQTLGYDVSLDTDSAYKPKILSTFQMCINSILILLMMKPGQYPSAPDLGIDIESYLHEYSDDKTIPMQIKNKLVDQCNRLNVVGITIDCYFDKTVDGYDALVIEITGTDQLGYGSSSNNVIIGITYNKLNKLYVRQVSV